MSIPEQAKSARRPAGPTTLGKYRLVERLGRGGMAEVWLAKMVGPGGFSRTLVVKRILPHLAEDPHFVKMFLAEARLSAQLSHPNIVAVHELGEVDGEFFIAMEFVNGRDLVTVLRTMLPQGVPEPGLAAFVVRDTARALGYAHGLRGDNGQPLRLIHRDVSPSNVMVSFDGAVKLVDFGLAKALADSNDEHTKTGTLKGKFGYMAPEQMTAVAVDARIDVWATGVVLWECLTGRRLFRGQTDMATIALVREGKIDPPSSLNPAVTPMLDEITMKALTRDRERRYQTCDDLAHDLDEAVRELRFGPERLAGLMREMFPDQLSVSKRIAIDGDGDTAAVDTGATSAAVPKTRRRRLASSPLFVATLTGAVLVTAMVASWAWRRWQRPAVVAVVTAQPPTVPAAPRLIDLLIDSRPAGARVFLDDEVEPRGTTPVQLSLPQTTTRQVRLSLDGYHELAESVRSDRDAQLLLTLVAKPVDPPPMAATTRHHSSSSAHASGKKAPVAAPVGAHAVEPSSDLSRGDVVDPFK